MKKITALAVLATIIITISCSKKEESSMQEEKQVKGQGKAVVYQVFTRLFGNKNTANKQWGTIEENGVGKFDDFTDEALEGIKELGVTHMWYTGVPHHAVIRDYTAYGISNDDPDVVKGRAGSPYAVKDYYSVNPDLASDPANRLVEFKALIDRTHAHGMKVIIDIVPNHVARHYTSLDKPEGVEDFGANDDTSVEYARNNDFYYIPGKTFVVPEPINDYKPLGGEAHPLSDGKFDENPAKWTGNGSREAQPSAYDWYETVKINYGVRPDGTYDFDTLPASYANEDHAAHYAFWQDKDLPASWIKFRDICFYWLDFGVDGFRFDMAEMVPVEFWSYLNASIKNKNPEAFLLAEVYQPHLYRDYLHKGKMDYLYDKVELYDTLKHIMQGHGSTDNIHPIQEGLADIEHHMLHFLENHDEQRIASPDFAGSAEKGKPAMVVSALISASPTMLYFAQDVGEPGEGDAGFGDPTRTTIFDYWGVPSHQRWMNGGKFDGGQLSDEEKALRDFYIRLMNFSADNKAMNGAYASLHEANRKSTVGYNDKVFAFARWQEEERIIVISNFSALEGYDFDLLITSDLINAWGLENNTYSVNEQLFKNYRSALTIDEGEGRIPVQLKPLESLVLKVMP